MYSHDYDTTYDPAMPVVEIQVESLEEPGNIIAMVAIVDSGSDTSFLPEKYLKRIGAERVRKARVRDIQNLSMIVDIYMVKIRIGDFEFFGVRVVGDKQDQVIIGRNILNEVIVTLNGLANIVEFQQ